MRHPLFSFTPRIRAGLLSSGAGLLLLATVLSGTALAADQPTTTTAATTTTAQSTTAPQTPRALGPHTHQLHGTVKTTPASGATTFTVTTQRFGDVTVSFTGATPRGHGHGRGAARSHELVSLTDLHAGDRVVVQGKTSVDGKSFVARRVHTLPARGAHATHIVGTVAAVASATGGTTLTIKLADGTTQSVTVSTETKIRPEGKTVADLSVGTKVTVVSKNGTATGVVVLPA